MEKGLQSAAVNHFFDAVLSLENKEECYKFFEDVCTVKEIAAIIYNDKKLKEVITARQLAVYLPSYFRG